VQTASESRPDTFFYGWRVVAASFFTLGLAVGMPYFGMPFFYDYFERPAGEGGFGWSRSTITLGLPLGTLATLWVGPTLAHRFAPRTMILAGTGLTALTLAGFGRMGGSVAAYWLLWVMYMTGNVFSGGLSHQVLLSQWFVRRRGTALAVGYLGISLIGALSARFVVKPLTEAFGFRVALQLMGCLPLLAWPLVIFVMRERPAHLGLRPDGEPADDAASPPPTAPAEQSLLNHAFSQTLLVLLVVSAAGRLLVGRLADRLAKRHVLTLTFALFAASLPPLLWLRPPQTPYLFAVLFGLAMGGDFLLVALMAGDHFGATSLTRVLAIILPVMTVGQTWFPYFVALLREWSGSYAAPLAVVFLAAAAGRAVMALLPELPNKPGDGERAAATF
jgi:MFS family permease